jgi:hypothetical protein
MEELKCFESIAYTTDLWTSTSNEGYLGLTVHGLTRDFEMISRILVTRELPEHHTGIAISKLLKSAFEEFAVKNKVNFFY